MSAFSLTVAGGTRVGSHRAVGPAVNEARLLARRGYRVWLRTNGSQGAVEFPPNDEEPVTYRPPEGGISKEVPPWAEQALRYLSNTTSTGDPT